MERNPYEASVLQRGSNGPDTTPKDQRERNRRMIEGLKARLSEIRDAAKDTREAEEIAQILENEAEEMRKRANEGTV